MKRSAELREVVLALYRTWVDHGFPADVLSASPDLTATLLGGRIVPGREFRLFIEAERELRPAAITSGPLVAFEEGSVGWVADTALLESPVGTVAVSFTFVFHREQGAWRIVYVSSALGQPMQDYSSPELTEYMASRLEQLTASLEADRPDLGPVIAPDGTVVLVFTDIEGSAAANQDVGDERWAELLQRHNALVRLRTVEAGGKVVRFLGDGFLLAFPSADRAVGCAVAVQRAMAAESWGRPMRVRIGVHTAAPIRSDDDDFWGRDVAYAARIGAAADGSEILVSAATRALVRPELCRFTERRWLTFKGFAGRQEVYAVDAATDSSS